MKQRGWPLWLLRDLPAFAAVMLSFWPLVIFLIVSGAKAVRHGKARSDFHARAAKLIASAECRLDHAFWREAYRRIGWKARLAPLNIVAPPEAAEGVARFRAYLAAFSDMERVVRSYVEHLRQQYRIKETDLVAHGSTDAQLCRAAHHALVGASCVRRANAPLALILSSARRARLPKDARGHTHARAPPFRILTREICNSHAPRARTRAHVQKKSPGKHGAFRGLLFQSAASIS